MHDRGTALAVKEVARVDGWTLPRTGWHDGPPDQVVERVTWYDAHTGEPITDPDRIARIEAQISRDAEEAQHGNG